MQKMVSKLEYILISMRNYVFLVTSRFQVLKKANALKTVGVISEKESNNLRMTKQGGQEVFFKFASPRIQKLGFLRIAWRAGEQGMGTSAWLDQGRNHRGAKIVLVCCQSQGQGFVTSLSGISLSIRMQSLKNISNTSQVLQQQCYLEGQMGKL